MKAEVIVADLATADGVATVERRAAAGDLTMLFNNAVPDLCASCRVRSEPCRGPDTSARDGRRPDVPSGSSGHAGDIINVSSMLAFSAGLDSSFLPKRAMYAATKAFISTFSEQLASELSGTGVRVQALCPAVVRTEFHDVDGKPVLRPNVLVMEPEDVVEASLAALAVGDVICSPALADRGLADHEREARHALFGAGRGAELSPRYAGKRVT